MVGYEPSFLTKMENTDTANLMVIYNHKSTSNTLSHNKKENKGMCHSCSLNFGLNFVDFAFYK